MNPFGGRGCSAKMVGEGSGRYAAHAGAEIFLFVDFVLS